MHHFILVSRVAFNRLDLCLIAVVAVVEYLALCCALNLIKLSLVRQLQTGFPLTLYTAAAV